MIYVPRVSESLIAHVAFEGLFARVNPSPMLSQFVSEQKSFAAPFASVRPFVGMPGLLMKQQLVPGDEGFATLSAVERCNASVQGHVILEASRRFEAPWTL